MGTCHVCIYGQLSLPCLLSSPELHGSTAVYSAEFQPDTPFLIALFVSVF